MSQFLPAPASVWCDYENPKASVIVKGVGGGAIFADWRLEGIKLTVSYGVSEWRTRFYQAPVVGSVMASGKHRVKVTKFEDGYVWYERLHHEPCGGTFHQTAESFFRDFKPVVVKGPELTKGAVGVYGLVFRDETYHAHDGKFWNITRDGDAHPIGTYEGTGIDGIRKELKAVILKQFAEELGD